MKYNCKILNIDDDVVTIEIANVKISGFSAGGCTKTIGEKALVDISLYDDLEIYENDSTQLSIEKKGNSLSYSLYGILNIDKAILNSIIDFEIEAKELFNYGYLDRKNVKIDVVRIDFDFLQ